MTVLKYQFFYELFHRYETVGPCQQAESGGRVADTYGKREAQSGGITSTSSASTSILVDTHAFYKSSSFDSFSFQFYALSVDYKANFSFLFLLLNF